VNYIWEGADKRKGFPVHDMKANRGRRGTALLIFSLDSRRRRVNNLTLGPFYLGERTAVPTARWVVGPRRDLEYLKRVKYLASNWIQTPDRSAHSLVAIPHTALRLPISVWDDMKIIW